MLLEVVRRGGLMGIARRGAIDTAALGEAVAAPADGAIRGLRFGAEPAAPQHPDGFSYEITVVEGDRRRTARLDEAELPQELRPVVSAALARAGPS
ncbi:MAG: protealysin inhibitor emfourin [Candidatus Dormibacteria bacterium]